MKTTVIIPVYNRLEHLRAGFLCLLKQTRQPYELIITDDGSSQKVLDFIGDLIPKAKFKIKHVIQKDKGFRKTRALNNAVKNAEGDLLIFCDQDLAFSEEYIETIEDSMKPNTFIMNRPYHTEEKTKNLVLDQLEKHKDYEEVTSFMDEKEKRLVNGLLDKDYRSYLLYLFKLKRRGIKLVGMSYALFKDDYIKVNGYDEKYQGWGEEDDDFGNRLSVAGIKGKPFKLKNLSMHLWHPFDPTKKKSANEDYYYQRKKEIFGKKDFFCKYGYNNSIDNDEVSVEILK